MSDDDSPWVPRWTVLATAATGVVAALAYALTLPYASYAAGITAVGVLYVLYKWGQQRERPSKYSDDPDEKRRQMEQEGRAGGYGGNQ
ncbi:hypothetical protein [Halobacterium sp. CBA1126]|uniref:hypothetical protein n=1 Tax=Halobacterium sp. CBA1126 TaxID=2668074 RepID=UPI0012F7F1DC|nr:hypothetical protein [Halobacterium sp. CBA1126]MUV60800.1 hypothetical protein [Halobacterium sp. CBA1126]